MRLLGLRSNQAAGLDNPRSRAVGCISQVRAAGQGL